MAGATGARSGEATGHRRPATGHPCPATGARPPATGRGASHRVGEWAPTMDLSGLLHGLLEDPSFAAAAQAEGPHGSVIAPDADAKLFVKATPAIRARRRHDELKARGSSLSFDKVLADIRARDQRDQNRAVAPLVMAPDAGILDTSFLSIEAAVQRAIELVERQRSLKAAKD